MSREKKPNIEYLILSIVSCDKSRIVGKTMATVLGIFGALAFGIGLMAAYLWYLTPDRDDLKHS